MTGWRQAVFVRQWRVEVIQRALANVLDEEAWSPATPRRLRIGSIDASSRGWAMIVPELANFFLTGRGAAARGLADTRLCRLARTLRSPVYQVDVRRDELTLHELDPVGRTRISGAPLAADPWLDGVELASDTAAFGLLALPGDDGSRAAALAPPARADYLGALAGFPGWTRHTEHGTGALIYEPRTIAGSHARAYLEAGPRR